MTPSAVGVTHYAPLGAAGIVAPMGPFCKPHVQRGVMILNKYRRLLLDWKKRYVPQAPEAVLDERFVEACHRLPWAEYQLDILLQGDSYERGEVVSELTADGYIRKLQAHLREEQYHEQPCLD